MTMLKDWIKGFLRPNSGNVERGMSLQEIEALFVDESKLTKSKKLWVQQKRFIVDGQQERSIERLPPGQHLTTGYPVLDLGIQPEIARDRWVLEVDGLVACSASLDWRALMALPQVSPISDIHCVTSWSRFDNRWEGVSTSSIIERCRPTDAAVAVMVESYDGYKTNLRLEDFAAPGALLAHSWDGEPLSTAHGAPVRLVIPHLYFWKSAKWIRKITFLSAEERGYWEVGGYHVRGDPWLQQRYRGSEAVV
jgi:DMSO/TMAO reductase YedYZ molybdopterin-dependent catalytic subunit